MSLPYSNPLFVFAGGTPYEYLTPNITLMQGKSITMLSCDSVIVDFITIPSSPHITGESVTQCSMIFVLFNPWGLYYTVIVRSDITCTVHIEKKTIN